MVFHSILKIFHSIPFCHLPYSIPKFPFHSIPCIGCRFYIIIFIIVTFYPNGCSQFENPKALDFEEIAFAPSYFSTLSLPSSLLLPTSFIKVLPLPQKINRFRFHISGYSCLTWVRYFDANLEMRQYLNCRGNGGGGGARPPIEIERPPIEI